MCTLVILRRPGEKRPVLIGSVRDEMGDRPWAPPDRHWPARPGTVAGLDRLGGGSWLGVNDAGVFAGILNRYGTLGPQAGKASRGELVLRALDYPTAEAASAGLRAEIAGRAYRPFNLIVADADRAWWLALLETGELALEEVPEGLSMWTSRGRNDMRDERVRDYLPRFEAAAVPDPDKEGGWASWERLLGDRAHDPAAGPRSAMCFTLESGFQSVSSSLIALGGAGVWRFAAGAPDRAAYGVVDRS